MDKATNIYQQRINDFLCRARAKVGALTAQSRHDSHRAHVGDRDCERELLTDLVLTIETLALCHSPLTTEQKMRLVELMTSRADLRTGAPVSGDCGVIVRGGAVCCGAGAGGAINLPLTGEQVTVRVNNFTRQLQSVITELYNRQAAIYFIDGGIPSSTYHPSALNRR